MFRRPASRRTSHRFVTSLSLFTVLRLCAVCFSQAGPGSEPQHDNTPQVSRVRHLGVPASFEQFAPYWTEEPGWHSDLQLRNNLAGQELVVTPALRRADGAEVSLAPMVIPPGVVAAVSLHDAIMNSGAQLSATYGSVVLRYRASVPKALNAVVMIHLEGHPVAFHVDASLQPKGWTRGSREGIWWLPRDTATDYLVLTNTADDSIGTNLVLRDSEGKSWQQKVPLGPRQTVRLSARSLLEKAGLRGS